VANAPRRLEYTITGDARDFNKTLRSIDQRLATSEKNAHGFARGLSSAFGSVGHAAGLAGAAIGAGLVVEATRSIKAFQESNKVARQTQAVLKSTGGAANVTAKEISNLATALSRKTGIDDEVVQSGENMLLTFRNIRNEAGKGNDIFNRSTKVLLDMSKALGVDSSKAAIQLGKALNDPVKGITALRRVGVTFTEQQQKQIDTLVKSGRTLDAQKMILRELTKEFGGSAVAQATSTEKLKVAFGNLEEDLGSGLAPAVDAIANKLTRFAIDVEPKVIRAADSIAKTFGRKDLSLDQKFRLSYDQARAGVQAAGR
jgi:phage-related minor tail protein